MGVLAARYLDTVRSCLDMPGWAADELVEEVAAHFEDAGEEREAETARVLGSPRSLAARLNGSSNPRQVDWPLLKLWPVGAYIRPRQWAAQQPVAMVVFEVVWLPLYLHSLAGRTSPLWQVVSCLLLLGLVATGRVITPVLDRFRWIEIERFLAVVVVCWSIAGVTLGLALRLYGWAAFLVFLAVLVALQHRVNLTRCRRWFAEPRPYWARSSPPAEA